MYHLKIAILNAYELINQVLRVTSKNQEKENGRYVVGIMLEMYNDSLPVTSHMNNIRRGRLVPRIRG